MRFTLLMVFCLLSSASFGQTKLISFKSHSGSNRNFRSAVENNLFGIEKSNFGIETAHTGKIDTIVRKNNKLIVFRSDTWAVNGKTQKTIFKKDTLNQVSSRPFLAIKNPDSLRSALKKKYAAYVINDLQFIDLDKRTRLKRK